MKTETYSLLRDAYQIIDGIPESNFALKYWLDEDSWKKAEPDCGTIACAAGWLALHPDMKKLGLTRDQMGTPMYLDMDGYDALAAVFGINWQDARNLFGTRGMSRLDEPREGTVMMTDKKLWMYRVRQFLAARDAERAQ